MPLTLTITLTDDGSISVQGIPDNPLIGLGILEMTKTIINGHYQKVNEGAQQRILPVSGVLPPGFNPRA